MILKIFRNLKLYGIQTPGTVFFGGVSFCIVVTNVNGKCSFKSVNYKKNETTKLEKKKAGFVM